MANRAIYLWVNVLFFLQLGPEFELVAADIFGFPIELGHEFNRTKMWFRMAMAVDAPGHRLIFVLVNNVHLVDPTVAGHTRDTSRDVGRVIEIDVVGQAVNANPVDRLAGPPALVDGLELGAGRVDGRVDRRTAGRHRAVAIDASGRGRDGGVSRLIDRIVAIAAVHLELAGVDGVAERDRLDRLVTGVQRNRAGSPQKQRRRIKDPTADQHHSQQGQEFIGPTGK